MKKIFISMQFILLGSLLLGACISPKKENFFKADHPNISVIGRTELSDEGHTFSYPNVTFRTAFEGTSLKMHLKQYTGKDGDNFFLVKIDQQTPFKVEVKPTQESYVLADSLQDGLHQLELIKITESNCGYATLKGFVLDDGKSLQKVKPKARKIEFVGNSITCGYGVEVLDAKAPFLPETENSYKAYATIAAQKLNADFQTNAFSGIGMYRNYNNNGTPMPPLYPLVMPYDGSEEFHPDSVSNWDFSKFQPDVFVIALGTNDIWNADLDMNAFSETYADFIATIRKNYGEKLPIVCTLSPLLVDKRRGMLEKTILNIVASEKKKGDTEVHYFEFSPCGKLGYGSSWHPSAPQQQMNGEELAVYLSELMDWGLQ